MISALYVETAGPYFGIAGIDPWDITRDARLYDGPWPVIAHPPCERWGRYWFGGPSVKVRKEKGADGGCFKAALHAVRKYGGVLEHPEGSHAWAHFHITKPPKSGGWICADDFGWTCCVEQGHYGHKARKSTWLYAVRTSRPELIWGASASKKRLDEGFHSSAERRKARAAGIKPVARLSRQERVETPVQFRNLLIHLVKDRSETPAAVPGEGGSF